MVSLTPYYKHKLSKIMNSKLLGFLRWLLCLYLWSMLANIFISRGTFALESGTFWHVTDFHVDQNYSITGDPLNLCHENSSVNSAENNGLYGNFNCDSPIMLVNATIAAMKKIKPNPDFIIWTGDNLPHTWNPDPAWDTIYEALKNITVLLRNAFPNISIYPSIGNHDSFPPNILMPEYPKDNIYTCYLKKGGWEIILPKEAWSTFEQGGFYNLQVKPGLRIISLNTILWYDPNNSTTDIPDPANQFNWLEEQLKNASVSQNMVYIIGHVPPGFYNRVPIGNISTPTYHLQHLKRYLNIIENFHMVIAGQFFGHLHMDMFQLFEFDKGIVSSSLLASSVTPWHSTLQKNENMSLPVNPAIRLMYFNQTDGALMDYNQYFLNLTEANQATSKPEFQLLYNFTQAYGVSDVSTTSLNILYEKLKSSEELFKTFYHYLSAGKDSVPCDSECKTAQLCSIAGISENTYISCMPTPGNLTTPSPSVVPPSGKKHPYSATTVYAIVGSILIVLTGAAIFAVLRLRKRVRRSQSQYQRFPEF